MRSPFLASCNPMATATTKSLLSKISTPREHRILLASIAIQYGSGSMEILYLSEFVGGVHVLAPQVERSLSSVVAFYALPVQFSSRARARCIGAMLSGAGPMRELYSPYQATVAPTGSGLVFSDPLLCARCVRRRHIRTCPGACERSVCIGCLRWMRPRLGSSSATRSLLDQRVCCVDCFNNGLDHRGPAPIHTQFMLMQARRAFWADDRGEAVLPGWPIEEVRVATPPPPPGDQVATPVAPAVPHPDEVPSTHLSETLFTSDFAPRGPDGRRRCECLECEIKRFTC